MLYTLLLLLSAFSSTSSSPLDAAPSNASTPSAKVAGTHPNPHCASSLGPSREEHGKLDYTSCDRAIAKLPREPRGKPVLRNFYVNTKDRSRTMPNMEIPITELDAFCIVQVLLSSSFTEVPHEQAVWQDLWGPARLILNTCVRAQRVGGIVTHIGK